MEQIKNLIRLIGIYLITFLFLNCGNSGNFVNALALATVAIEKAEVDKKDKAKEEIDKKGKDEKTQISSLVGNFLNYSNFILTTDKRLFSFGSNAAGELGVEDNNDKTLPTEILDPMIKGKVEEVFVSSIASFILTTDKRLFSFGSNHNGQLGLGLDDSFPNKNTPTEITDVNIKGKVDKVFVGNAGFNAFVVTTGGKLFSFGNNAAGELGVGDNLNKTSPTEVIDNRLKGKVKEIFVNQKHTLILTTDKKLFSFGANDSGQLGLGDEVNKNVPTEITSLSGKVEKVFSSGLDHNFVLTTDGKLFSFGSNSSGQLGLGDKANRNVPTEIDGMSGKVKKVLTSSSRSLLLTNDKKLFISGYSSKALLTQVFTEIAPVSGKVEKIFGGRISNFLLTTDGKLLAFGENEYGELGLGNKEDKISDVLLPTEITDKNIKGKIEEVFMSNNGYSTFILTTDKRLFSFGANGSGQLGVGDKINRDSPTEVQLP